MSKNRSNADRRKPLFERLKDRIEFEESGCWYWTGAAWGGYGLICITGHARKAYKALYEDKYGPVPAGLELDHLCKRSRCVNPDHLEPVTHAENVRRGSTKFSDELVELIKRAPGSSREVAKQFGVSPTQVKRFRHGRR